MALFSRLFSPKKANKVEQSTNLRESKFVRSFNFSIDKNEVRVLLFRECDWRGRKLLFDSTTVEKVHIDQKTPLQRPRSDSNDMVVEISKGYGYKYKKPRPDTTNLGEMMFGSIAMASRGPSLKVHSLKDPPRIVFTKIIQAPRSGVRKRQISSDDKMCEKSKGSSFSSIRDTYGSGSFDSRRGSFELTIEDSGFSPGHDSSTMLSCDWLKQSSPQACSCGSLCPLHPPSFGHSLEDGDQVNSSSSLHSNSSLSSLRRRWARSVTTSLDFVLDTSQPQLQHGKRTKLGVAIVVPLMLSCSQEMEQFLMERLPLVNNILNRLQHSTEQAYCHRDVFVHMMVQASANAIKGMFELVCGYRLDKPVWLTLTSDQTNVMTKTELANRLASDLGHLLTTLDTKHTNFFVSTLLTAVLTHHLGWVPTVLTNMSLHSASMFADLSKSHPYNPLWAQLSDLQGALGYPPKIAKTVVIGRSEILVQKLLSILSYFIRCGHVTINNLQRDEAAEEETLLEHLIEPEPDITCFDKDAIREFSQATLTSFEGNSSTSASTLTKSKTVLSLKTFCVNECEMDNTNSLESGFESCNEFSGESFEDGGSRLLKPLRKMKKISSHANLLETSFSQDKINELNLENQFKSEASPEAQSHLPITKFVEDDYSSGLKMESEKQLTSVNVCDVKFINSKLPFTFNGSRKNSFIKENFLQPDTSDGEAKDCKVVFVLGENEELVNIKGQNEANVPDNLIDLKHKTDVEPPVILINSVDSDNPSSVREIIDTKNEVEFSTGNVKDKVIIVHAMPMEIEELDDSESLRPIQRQRCLSVPEEAVSETDWVKSRRCKEAIQIVRRWLSDSAIERTSLKPLGELSVSENKLNFFNVIGATPASVFRTSNRSLKDTKVESVENFVEKVSFEVPTVEVENVDSSSFLEGEDYIRLPSQSCVEPWQSEVSEVAASMFGAVSDSFCPEFVLQGVTHVTRGWDTDLQRALLLEAHASDVEHDLAEAVCIVANTDTWEVELVSSHSLAVDQGGGVGGKVGMSQLVANMLETTQQLCALSVPPEMCLSHIETKLLELCVRSQALADLLLNSDFLDIATLTSALDLEANDVPLLLSVASAHTPLVTRKYGLSYQ